MRPYDREKAVEYARQWWKGENPHYPVLCGEGGDSTNFASQCLCVGCGGDSEEWYCREDNCTESWRDPLALREYLFSPEPGKDGPCAVRVYPWAVGPGDLVQLKSPDGGWRTLVVLSNRGGEVRVAAHSYQSEERLLGSYRGESFCLHILGIRDQG